MDKLTEKFKESVKLFLQARQLKQSDLANTMKMDPGALNRLLNTDISPKLETVEKVAAALGIPAWEMLKPPPFVPDQSVPGPRRDLARLIAGMNEREVAFALESLQVLLKGLRGEPLDPSEPGREVKKP